MKRNFSILVGLLALLGLKLLGDALSQWLGVRVPGSFWGFLALWVFLHFWRMAPTALAGASAFLLSHLTLFLLPSLVAAVVGLRWAPREIALLLVCGLPITLLMAAACGLLIAALQRTPGKNNQNV